MKISLPLLLFFLTLGNETGAEGVPPIYAFQNALGFGTDKEEAKFLKKQGYAGVGQVAEGGVGLARKVEDYKSEGLIVLSVYRDLNGNGLDAADLAPLADSNAIIELTVKKLTADAPAKLREICLVAESVGMRVALYPHYGYGISTMFQALEMVGKVDYPNLGVMFNLCHFLRCEVAGTLGDVVSRAGDRLFAVSISGADAGGKG